MTTRDAVTESKMFALVTGTSSGIGAAVAKHLVGHGWDVVGIARRRAAIDHARYQHVALDLREISRAMTTITDRVGPLLADRSWDRIGLVNNAAFGETGVLERLEPGELASMFAVNSIMPISLMAFVASGSPRSSRIRVVNVSSGAAVRAFPGLTAYCSTKAALRMAGMVFGTELDARAASGAADVDGSTTGARDIAVLSYEPGIVDTPMQLAARSKSRDEFPSVELFQRFHSEGMLDPPEAPAAEIVEFLEADGHAHFTERRRGVS